MARSKDPIMRAEFWFGGRKNKKLVEIKHKLSEQDNLVSDMIEFLKSKGYEFKCMWPERDPDFIDDKGRSFWVEEGLIQYNNKKKEISEFFIRNDEKLLKGKKPHVRVKDINSRRRQVNSQEYDMDNTHNSKVMDEIMNRMLLGDLTIGDADDGAKED